MRTPMRALVMAGVAVAAVQPVMSTAHAAAEDTKVSIVAVDTFGGGGTFEASGGGLCADGTTSQPEGTQITERRRTLTFQLDKVFTCSDGSGTFTLRLRAWYLPCGPADRGVWRV